jgi:O-antigen biosynthesis protein
MRPDASVIIVTYNSATHIDACLSALSTHESSAPYEIIVVDNASRDNTTELIQRAYPGVRLLAEQHNRGFAGAVNRGVSEAQGSRIALLNHDATPFAGWLDDLVAPLRDVRVGVVGSKVLGSDGHIQSVGAILDDTLVLPSYRGEGEVDIGQYDQATDVWSVHGAAMAFPRQLWSDLGGFDEGYFPLYLEESDFCERARRAGYRVITAPQAVVQHAEAVSTGKYSPEFYFCFLRNRLRYAVKWLDWTTLWDTFRPAEHARLRTAPLLDRRVARLVYQAGVPPLGELTAAQQAAVLATARALREERLPDDGVARLMSLLEEARTTGVHTETIFHSRFPLVAWFRTRWNNIATRWYLRPNLDQQTRFNLAIQRALNELVEQTTARATGDALDIALLAWRLETLADARVSSQSPAPLTD